MSFHHYYTKVTHNSALAFLRRNINHCPISVRSHCYKSFVRPILEYASPIWAPHLQSDICAIEKIQRSVARYTMNNYSWRSSVTNMLTSLNWPSLESRRTFCKLVMFYKIINCQIEVPSISLTSMPSVTRGHSQRFRIPQARINSYILIFLFTIHY